MRAELDGATFDVLIATHRSEDARLNGAVFRECNLTGARIAGANLFGVTFERCKLMGVNFHDGLTLTAATFSRLRSSIIRSFAGSIWTK